MKYNEWLNEWLENYVKPGVKPRTYINYSCAISYYIVPYLGKYELSSLNSTILQQYVKTITEKGRKNRTELSAGTVGFAVTILQLSLRTAVERGLIGKSYAEIIKRPKSKEQKMNCFTVKEQREIERAVLANPISKRFGFVLSLYTGLRIGEVLALRWCDVDLENCLIKVSVTCRDCYVDGKYVKVLNSPKTPSSRRTIPMPKNLAGYLSILQKHSTGIFVISNGNKEISERSYQMSFSRFLNKLGLPHRSFHALRHTFATRALECGMDVRTLAEILGHKNPTVTLTRYAHSMTEHKMTMMNRLGNQLRPPRTV